MRVPRIVRGLLIVGLLLAGFAASAHPARGADGRCFAETGKCVGGLFLEYWEKNGGLAQQGLPLTDEFTEVNPTDGKSYTVQYFERARFERHPEKAAPYNVLLGLLGREQLTIMDNGAPPAGGSQLPPGGECRTFTETKRTACGLFLAYWTAHGGLAQQGLPITDAAAEVNPTDGKAYTVQYFERARFEYHPELAGTPYAVLLGLLGREQYKARYAPSLGPGAWAKVVDTTGTTGLRLRAAPSPWEALLAVLPEGSLVQVLSGAKSGGNGDPWYTVSAAGRQGWVDGIYLQPVAAITTPAPAPVPAPAPSGLGAGQWAAVSGTAGTTGLRLRAAPSPSEQLLTVFPEGTRLKILEGPAKGSNNDPWYRVAWNGSWGWVDGIYLVPSDAPARGEATAPVTPAPGSGRGAALVEVAMAQVGKPYVWGATGPNGFDCSGLTLFAARQALGVTLPRTADAQAWSGVHVAPDQLAPGDLVFYENTYAPGITHVGIYIGGGRWVSAVNEQVGVAVLSLDEPYWKMRYAGARRIAP